MTRGLPAQNRMRGQPLFPDLTGKSPQTHRERYIESSWNKSGITLTRVGRDHALTALHLLMARILASVYNTNLLPSTIVVRSMIASWATRELCLPVGGISFYSGVLSTFTHLNIALVISPLNVLCLPIDREGKSRAFSSIYPRCIY